MKSLMHWLLRAVLAGIFIYHGLIKFPVAAGMAAGMGMPLFIVYVLALAETIGGVLILIGGLKITGAEMATRVAAAIFAVVMVGAISLVHWPQWSFVATPAKPMGGMEFQTLVLVVSVYFLVKGNEV